MYYPYFTVLDSLGAVAAIMASHSLVWGHWFRTATIAFIASILIMVFYALLGIVTGLLFGDDSLLTFVINLFCAAFTTPYLFTLGYVQVYDLKLRRPKVFLDELVEEERPTIETSP